MLTTVLAFAVITALFELIMLVKFANLKWLTKRWVQYCVHTLAVLANLTVHWGTIVGTMTAITAGLVSFATVPLAIFIMRLMINFRARKQGHDPSINVEAAPRKPLPLLGLKNRV